MQYKGLSSLDKLGTNIPRWVGKSFWAGGFKGHLNFQDTKWEIATQKNPDFKLALCSLSFFFFFINTEEKKVSKRDSQKCIIVGFCSFLFFHLGQNVSYFAWCLVKPPPPFVLRPSATISKKVSFFVSQNRPLNFRGSHSKHAFWLYCACFSLCLHSPSFFEDGKSIVCHFLGSPWPGAMDTICVSHMSGRDSATPAIICCLPRCELAGSWIGEQSQDSNPRTIQSWVLASQAATSRLS